MPNESDPTSETNDGPASPDTETPQGLRPSTTRRRLPVLELLQNRNYRLLWASGWAWHAGRWTWIITSGFLTLQVTDSTFMTQLVGVAFFSSMLLGGVISGIIADAFDRRLVLVAGHAFSMVVTAIVVALVISDVVEGWHMVVLSMLFGIPHTLDMAARRTFALDLVGREGLPYANALESLSMTAAGMTGPFIAGALITVVPLGKADAAAPYVFITAIYLAAFIVLLRIRSSAPQARLPFQVRSAFTAVADGARAVAGNRPVIGALGIVVIMNLAYYSYIPLVPVFADRVLGVGPTLLGVLGSAQGFGAFVSTIFIATRRKISRNSTYYVFGTLIALGGLLAFSLSRVYPLSVAALVVAGMGMAGFLTMLVTLVLLSVQEDMRGRAMGFVNMAIGISPVSMLLLGWMAGSFGPGLAVTISSSAGLVLAALWSYRAKEMRKL